MCKMVVPCVAVMGLVAWSEEAAFKRLGQHELHAVALYLEGTSAARCEPWQQQGRKWFGSLSGKPYVT